MEIKVKSLTVLYIPIKSYTVLSSKVLVNSIMLSVLNIRLYVERCAFLLVIGELYQDPLGQSVKDQLGLLMDEANKMAV